MKAPAMQRSLFLTLLAAALIAGVLNPPGHAHSQSQAVAVKPPAYYVAEFELTDPEGMRPYSAAVESTFLPFGGKYAVRGGKVASLEGEPMKRVIMIMFPSLEQAQAWYASSRYQEIMPIRHKSAQSRVFIMEGAAN